MSTYSTLGVEAGWKHFEMFPVMGYNTCDIMHELDPSRLPVPINREGQITRREALQASARAALVSLMRFPVTRIGLQAVLGGVARLAPALERSASAAVSTQVPQAAAKTVIEQVVLPQVPSQLEIGKADSSHHNNLIDLHIETNPWHSGKGDVRIKETGIPVWVLVAYSKHPVATLERVAEDFAISLDTMKAAMAYYDENKEAIDYRLYLNTL